MTAIKIRYVQQWVDTRHGNVVVRHRFRRAGFKPVALPAPGSDGFLAAYEAAMKGETAPSTVIGLQRSKPGTINDLIASFKGSAAYVACGASTTASYNSNLEAIRAECGDDSAARATKDHIDAMFAKKVKAHSIGYANKWLRLVRRLFEIAIDKGIRPDNPAARVEAIKVKRSDVEDGFHTWTEDEIDIFRAGYPLGTKPRLAMELMLCTGSRVSDAVKIGRQHGKTDKPTGRRMIKVRQQKTGKWVAIPMHPDLAEAIDAMPTAEAAQPIVLQYLTTEHGKAMAAKTLGNNMRKWCDAIGLDVECSSHGLRKACARRLAEAGCTEKEIASITGHADMRVLALYVRMADDAKLAINATDKVVRLFKRMEDAEVVLAADTPEAMAATG